MEDVEDALRRGVNFVPNRWAEKYSADKYSKSNCHDWDWEEAQKTTLITLKYTVRKMYSKVLNSKLFPATKNLP